MSSSFKLKVVAVGQRSVKDIFFNNCNQISKSFSKSSLMTVGVDIKVGRYSNEDELTMSIWDISKKERFTAFYNTFFRGATAYLIFYEISKDQSFWEIESWINIIRTFTVNNPIFLIVYKPNLKIERNIEDIERQIEEYQIENFFILPVRERIRSSIIFDEIGQRILEIIGTESSIKKYTTKFSSEEANAYQRFINFFTICPICGSKNHQSNLNQIYFPTNSNRRKFKESLLSLMNQSEKHDKAYMKRTKIGIPCCSCYKKVFS
ncbi:MAG: hypothetical protein ACW98D_06870 [Promethearchaeota archaeon]|jgi:GTPase SAR1 family protein